MRIAVNTRFLLKNKLEGIGRFTFEVLKRMVKDHPEHEFIFFFDRSYDKEFVFAENITPVVLFPQARHPFLFLWWFEWSIPRALREYQVDVFLSTDNFCSLGTDVKTILVIHDLAFVHFPKQVSFLQRKYYSLMTPGFIAKASRIITVSEYTKSDIVQQFNCHPSRIEVACNGCDPVFHPLDNAEKLEIRQEFSHGKPYFIFIGAIHPRKNVHNLIKAFSLFKTATNSDYKLLLVGRFAWNTGEVKEAYDLSDFKKDIIFTGFVPDEKVPLLMGAALALTYVSQFEGFGIPLLEAMHCEIPIITSNVSSLPQVAGRAALYVHPKQISQIARAMEQLFNSPQLCSDLVEEGKEQRTKFTWEKAASVVYNTIIEVSQSEDNY